MAGLVTLLFFVASFSPYMGWIEDTRLGDYFLIGVSSLVSAVVWLVLELSMSNQKRNNINLF